MAKNHNKKIKDNYAKYNHQYFKRQKVVDYFQHVQFIMNMHGTMQQAAMNYYPTTGLKYVVVPYIVGITGACENVSTLFTIGNKKSVPAFF